MMNHIINFVLKNKFAVWLMTIIVTVAGLYAGMNMKQESIPDVNMPYLFSKYDLSRRLLRVKLRMT